MYKLSLQRFPVIAFGLALVAMVLLVLPTSAGAITCDDSNMQEKTVNKVEICVCKEGTVETSFKFNGTNCTPENKKGGIDKNPIYVMATTFMKFASVLVGAAVTGGIIYGGILYSTAQGNPAQTQKGLAVVSNAVLGLILFILMFAIINFLVPGGLFE